MGHSEDNPQNVLTVVTFSVLNLYTVIWSIWGCGIETVCLATIWFVYIEQIVIGVWRVPKDLLGSSGAVGSV